MKIKMLNKELEICIKYSVYSWLDLKINSHILCFNIDDDIIDTLSRNGYKAYKYNEKSGIKYDYAFCNYIIEKNDDYLDVLNVIYSMLKDDGKMYLVTDNKLGFRYSCGELFDNSIKLHTKKEIVKILKSTKFIINKTFSILPNVEAAQLIYDETFLPNESLAIRYIPVYKDSNNVYGREELMYDSVSNDVCFHNYANNYLFVCSKKNGVDNLLSVTLSPDRGYENSCITRIYKDTVTKEYVFNKNKIYELKEHSDYLSAHNIKMVQYKIENNSFVMPFVEGDSLVNVLQKYILNDFDKFLAIMDKYRDVVYSSSKIVDYTDKGPILERCYIDLVPLNCFWIKEDFLFFDQEFFVERFPANLIMWRAIIIILSDKPELLNVCSKEYLFERYGFKEYAYELGLMANEFISNLRNKTILCEYNEKHCINYSILNSNIKKMELKVNELIETCFDNINEKGICVIGEGECLNEFICTYQHDYNILGIYSDNEDFIQHIINDFKILDIASMPKIENCKYIICANNAVRYLPLLRLLCIENIGIYSNVYTYPGRSKYMPGDKGLKKHQVFENELELVDNKKYNIGYIAGVFDLFHIGHLNLFKRAKSMCNYLIVGVVSDKGVTDKKKTNLVIPFDERIELVRSCKYVDEAVEIPFEYCQTTHAFRKYHFDVQFSGSDYENDEWWLQMKDYLRSNGSDMVFLPYTKKRTSTTIKKEIGECHE